MKAKQLSVFLENKGGRLTEVTDVLGSAGINLSAMSIAVSFWNLLRSTYIKSQETLGHLINEYLKTKKI